MTYRDSNVNVHLSTCRVHGGNVKQRCGSNNFPARPPERRACSHKSSTAFSQRIPVKTMRIFNLTHIVYRDGGTNNNKNI